MPHNFYRKERKDKFEARFEKVLVAENLYGLKTGTVFQAHNFFGEKKFSITVNNEKLDIVASVYRNQLKIKIYKNKTQKIEDVNLSEAEIADLLKNTPKNCQNSLRKAVQQLCRDHATCSTSSPFISGCIVDNFKNNTRYAGFKLYVKLKSRRPFKNPSSSGCEKEYFLIGEVKDTDCQTIYFLGETKGKKDVKVRERVAPRSRIPIRRRK